MSLIMTFLLSVCVFVTSIFTTIKSGDQMAAIKDLIPPPPNLENMSVGLAPQMADLLWVRAIQDFDYCENEIAKQRCQGNSWLYKMLDTITQLDPEYRMPYAVGALALSVIISDIEGASALFDKAVIHYPNDWRILYRAGYHALLEEKNNLKAAERFDRCATYGGPIWLKGLAGRLYNKAGHAEDVQRLIDEMSQSEENKWIAERIKKKIKEEGNANQQGLTK